MARLCRLRRNWNVGSGTAYNEQQKLALEKRTDRYKYYMIQLIWLLLVVVVVVVVVVVFGFLERENTKKNKVTHILYDSTVIVVVLEREKVAITATANFVFTHDYIIMSNSSLTRIVVSSRDCGVRIITIDKNSLCVEVWKDLKDILLNSPIRPKICFL